MANPSVNNQQEGDHGNINGGGNHSNRMVPENSSGQEGAVVALTKMKHNPGISLDWTQDEQLLLEEGLLKHASDSILVRYAKIAMQLQDKTVRDVALRCRWMTKKEKSKRRKEDHNVSRKSKDKKERVSDPSTKLTHLVSRPIVPPYSMPTIPLDSDDGISCKAIGGAMGQLFEQNAQAFNQISAHFTSFQHQENINLFCQTRENIYSILNNLNDMSDIMRQMPPLPTKLNEELAVTVLGHQNISMK